MRISSTFNSVKILCALALLLGGCEDDDPAPSANAGGPLADAGEVAQGGMPAEGGEETRGGVSAQAGEMTPAPDSRSYLSTFEALQAKLFEGQGCTEEACHGSASAGGLKLTADVSYAQLIEIPSEGSALSRVEPGDRERSYLYQKLLAALEPDTVQVAGSAMPIGRAPIPQPLLDALRLWIYAGAPEEGTVLGTAELLDLTLPPPQPLTITPLSAPDPAEGFQLTMPSWMLPGESEREVCFVSYFDVRDQVPDEMKDETGEYAYIGIEELRQDPQSHHLILNMSRVPVEEINHPDFGAWTCHGGPRAGEVCDPLESGVCGEGQCATEAKDGFACIGYGPPVTGGGRPFFPIGGAQKAQNYNELPEGVYRRIPLQGILMWNSHAFNLTSEEHLMNGRLNFLYAENPQYASNGLFLRATSNIFKPRTPPFEREEVCATITLLQGTHLFTLSSHTHQRGERFTIFDPNGDLIYENMIYNDPLRKKFDPPLIFDSEIEEERTLRYCAVYNNGVTPEGDPDPETVTRYSRLPDSVFIDGVPGECQPIACASGEIGSPCAGVDDHATCDSAPGAGDGMCDACAITGGESTENEMFLILGDYYLIEDE